MQKWPEMRTTNENNIKIKPRVYIGLVFVYLKEEECNDYKQHITDCRTMHLADSYEAGAAVDGNLVSKNSLIRTPVEIMKLLKNHAQNHSV